MQHLRVVVHVFRSCNSHNYSAVRCVSNELSYASFASSSTTTYGQESAIMQVKRNVFKPTQAKAENRTNALFTSSSVCVRPYNCHDFSSILSLGMYRKVEGVLVNIKETR